MNDMMVKRYLKHSRLAAELVEDALAVERSSTSSARDVAELVAECLQLKTMSQAIWRHVLQMLYAEEQPSSAEDFGPWLKMASTKSVDVFDHVCALIAEAQAHGHTVKDDADFRIAHHEITKIKEDIERHFPPPDEQMRQESLAAFLRGEFASLEDVLRDA